MWVILFSTIVILIEKVKTVLSSQNDLIFYGEVFIRYIYVLIPYIFHSFVSFVKLFDFHLLVCYHANTILTVFMYYLQGNIFSPPPPFYKNSECFTAFIHVHVFYIPVSQKVCQVQQFEKFPCWRNLIKAALSGI